MSVALEPRFRWIAIAAIWMIGISFELRWDVLRYFLPAEGRYPPRLEAVAKKSALPGVPCSGWVT